MTHQERPVVRLRPKISPQKLRFGFPWVYADELVLDRRTRNIAPGAIVGLQDAARNPLGACAFNANSKIICRVLDRDPEAQIDQTWLSARLTRALDLRDRLYDMPYYRLIHAEADGMPGVIIDRFGDTFVVQPNAAWADRLLPEICAALQTVAGAKTVVMNGTGRTRGLEGLPEKNTVLCGDVSGLLPVPMNGATYMADLAGGQKTGLFYDQRPNQAFAARLAKHARVLDVFTHVGGFALAALTGGAASALGVDSSTAALELARKGAEASGVADRFETRAGDAFEVMDQLKAEGRQFDLVVCDPPAFAPSKPALEAGLRAYARVARLGAELTAPGGYLVLCSCSHAADPQRFHGACLRGIGKAGRWAQILHSGSAGPDHPTHASLSENAYLKTLFLRLD
jgi:23S rRNA (cytosine1962-C5)-methyltransferase